MSIGIHAEKKSTSTLNFTDAINRVCNEMKLECVQIFTHGPRTKSEIKMDKNAMKECCNKYRVYVHTSYCTSWKPEGLEHMKEQLRFAEEIGAKGIVLHLGKIDIKDHIDVLSKLDINKVPTLLEMRAIKPGKNSYQTTTELNSLCEALQESKLSPEKVGICIDTAHLSAGKIPLRTSKDVETYMSGFSKIAISYIKLLHFNGNIYDPKIRAGDKHCVPCSEEDKVFSSNEQGYIDIAKWFISRNLDIILEQEYTQELCTFASELNKKIRC